MLSMFVLAVALAMDAAAASASRGLAAERVGLRETLLVATWFGAAQGAMAAGGWALGVPLGHVVAAWDHWIAFALLVGIGAKTIHEGVRGGPEETAPSPFSARALAPVALATSIDALAAGVTLPLLDAPPAGSVLAIAAVTAALSAVGLHAGRRLGAALGKGLDVVGGLVLVALGVKILVEHTVLDGG